MQAILLIAYCQFVHTVAINVAHCSTWHLQVVQNSVLASLALVGLLLSVRIPRWLALHLPVFVLSSMYVAAALSINIVPWWFARLLLAYCFPLLFIALQIGITVFEVRFLDQVLASKNINASKLSIFQLTSALSSLAIAISVLPTFGLLEWISFGWFAFAVFAVQCAIASLRLGAWLEAKFDNGNAAASEEPESFAAKPS